ncbi:hypothetical protein [Lysinibacillus sp. G4S2]|uniref:hypothetical protein n=1 Tax=Lysinibacillus sp. G4S2 TaxID=3055859 RepID=UPI0025A03C81|nr:hypothetical protein [Lysinibacillus sp. G4S2]MDM5249029.1 hypothetical protein [Lysinibacillus sp. G4S2]
MENLQKEESVEMESIKVVEEVEATVQEQQENPLEQEKQELQKEIERLEQEKFELENQRLQIMLEKHGISFAKEYMEKYGYAKTADERLDVITQLLNEIKIDMGFKPKEVAKQDDYTAHKQNGDAKGMIASKFAKLFK